MSERFVKYIPSKRHLWLQTNHPNACLLLMQIARRARRIGGEPDGLKVGQCFIGDYLDAGIETMRKYRTAKEVLVRESAIVIVETCRTRKKPPTGNTRSATTVSTLVRLLNSEFWDINSIDDDNRNDNRNDNRPTTDRQPTDNKQERQESKESKETKQPPTPEAGSVGGGSPRCCACLASLDIPERQKLILSELATEAQLENAIAIMHASKKPVERVFAYLQVVAPKQLRVSLATQNDRRQAWKDWYAKDAKAFQRYRVNILVQKDRVYINSDELFFDAEQYEELQQHYLRKAGIPSSSKIVTLHAGATKTI